MPKSGAERKRAFYQRHREAEIARHRRWVDEHPEHLREYGRKRYAANPEPKKAQSKAWRDRNPGRNAAACMRWKERQKKAKA